jgi:hypothetical protein
MVGGSQLDEPTRVLSHLHRCAVPIFRSGIENQSKCRDDGKEDEKDQAGTQTGDKAGHSYFPDAPWWNGIGMGDVPGKCVVRGNINLIVSRVASSVN